MGAKVNEVVAGKYDHKGESVVYGDTDSVYFSAFKTLQKEIVAVLENLQLNLELESILYAADENKKLKEFDGKNLNY